MNDFLPMMIVGGAGLLLGLLFFGSLWVTVHQGASSDRPALWFVGSFLLRMPLALVAFYLIAGTHWQRLLACLIGFAIARFIVMWATRLPVDVRAHPTSGIEHAS